MMRPLPIFVSTRVLFKSPIYKSAIVQPVTLQPLHRTKKKQATLLVCLFRFFVCSFVYLFDRLFVCVSCSFFLCFFLVSLRFDDRCSDKCQNLDEYFVKNRQVYEFLCVPLKPTTCEVSFPEVIMIANVFTPQKHQIL